ncbi:MAG TPA: hypothetical protein PKG48_06105 [Bacteroidales bacterium]|nr:hypothetical protein [Bacteroidales bacterium]HPS62964.1 hypothetical protein [Bacteroidales bacterium]
MNRALIILLILTVSCSSFFKKKNERVLARVGDSYLYESELKGVVAAGTSAKDSLVITRTFVENWVRSQLVVQQAEKNLPAEQLDFTRQLEAYKNSLAIYAYENALVRQKLDTVISDEEIQDYYDANQQNFLLKDNIVQIQYVKLPLKSSVAKQVRQLLSADSPNDRTQLSELCEKNAADYFLDNENWIPFSDVLKEIPVKAYNQEEFLQNHRELEYRDSAFVYLMKIKDFKIRESVSPLDFEKQRIRDIILNKRKIDLIHRMQDDLFTNAQKKNQFEIY